MSDLAAFADKLDSDEQISRIDRNQAELQKLLFEYRKLLVEKTKLATENAKLKVKELKLATENGKLRAEKRKLVRAAPQARRGAGRAPRPA